MLFFRLLHQFCGTRWKVRVETCNTSKTRHYLAFEYVKVSYEALFLSYGVIGLPWLPLLAIWTSLKSVLPAVVCLAACRIGLYHKIAAPGPGIVRVSYGKDYSYSYLTRETLPDAHILTIAITLRISLASFDFYVPIVVELLLGYKLLHATHMYYASEPCCSLWYVCQSLYSADGQCAVITLQWAAPRKQWGFEDALAELFQVAAVQFNYTHCTWSDNSHHSEEAVAILELWAYINMYSSCTAV